MIDAIRGDGFSISDESVISLSVTDKAVIIATTVGFLALRCLHPRFIVRDYVAGQPLDFRARRCLDEHALSCGRAEAVFSKRQPKADSGPPQPDCVPVRQGWFVVELPTRTDYHPWCSLQLVAITKSQELILEFSEGIYRCTVPRSGDFQVAFDEITDGSKCGHCSIYPDVGFLDWLPSRRT